MEHKNTYRACVPASPPIPIHGSNNTDGKSTPHRHHHHPPHTINNTSATTNPISCCEELRDGAPTSSEGGSLRRAPRQSSCASMIEESSSGSVFITHQTSRTMSYLTPRGEDDDDDDDDEDDEEENLSYVDGMMSTVIRPHRLVLLTPANSSNKLCIQHNHANTHTPHQHHHHHRWKEEGGSSTTENTPTQQRLGKGPQSALHLQQLHHIVDDNADDDDVSKHRRRGSDPSPTNSATHAHHPPITSLEEKRHVSVASRHIPRRSPPPTWVPRSAPTTFATLSSRTPRSKCRDDDDHDGASNNNKKKSMTHEEEGEEEMSVLVLPLPTTAMTEVEVCACRARAAARQHLRSSTPILCECNSPVCSAKTMAVAAPRTASRVVIRAKKKDEGVEDHQPVLHVAEQHALHLHNDDNDDSHTPPQQLDHHHQQPYRPLLLRHPISILSLEVEDDALAMTANTTNNNNKNNKNNNSDAVMRKELLDGHDVLHTPFSLSEETIDAVLSRPTTSSSQQQQQQHQRDSYSHRHSSPPTYHTRPSFVDLSSHAVGHLPLSSTRRNHRWRSTSVSHSNNNRSQKQQQPSQHNNNNNNNGESSCAPRSRSDNNARRGSSPPTSVSEATVMMMNMDTPSSSQRQEHHQHNNMDYFDDSTSPPLPASAMSDGEHNNKMLSSTPWMPSFVSISHLEVLQAAAVPPSSTSFSSTKDEMKEKRASLREGCAQHGFACFGQDSMVASSHSLGGVHQQQQQQQQQQIVVDGSSNCSRRGACIPRLPAPASLFSLNSMLHSHPDGGGSDFFLDQGSGI